MPAVLDGAAVERLRRMGGGRLLRGMIELFLQHGPARVAAIRAAAETGDAAAMEFAAHTLKSSAGNLGAFALQASAERLEQEAVAGRIDRNTALQVPEQYEQCAAALGAVLEELTP